MPAPTSHSGRNTRTAVALPDAPPNIRPASAQRTRRPKPSAITRMVCMRGLPGLPDVRARRLDSRIGQVLLQHLRASSTGTPRRGQHTGGDGDVFVLEEVVHDRDPVHASETGLLEPSLLDFVVYLRPILDPDGSDVQLPWDSKGRSMSRDQMLAARPYWLSFASLTASARTDRLQRRHRTKGSFWMISILLSLTSSGVGR